MGRPIESDHFVHPLPVCCCGCSITVGTRSILFTHFFIDCLWLLVIFREVVLFKNQGIMASMSITGVFFYSAWSVLGIVLTLNALYGVHHRLETNVRFYFVYLLVCLTISAVWVCWTFGVEGHCDKDGNFLGLTLNHSYAHAYFCGTLRIASLVLTSVLVVFMVYAAWVVHSWILEISSGRGMPHIGDLTYMKEHPADIRRNQRPDYISPGVHGLPHARRQHHYPSIYGTHESSVGMPMQGTLWGCKDHDIDYPPAPHL